MASIALSGRRFGRDSELTQQGLWLVSRRYDVVFIILSAVLVVFPHLSFALLGKKVITPSFARH